MTLTEFLLARIAEDEAVARRVSADDWHIVEIDYVTPYHVDAAELLARHDPARVLAECEAKRRIMEWHGERDDCCEEVYGDFQFDAEPELSAGTDAFGQLTMRQSIGYQPFIGCKTLMMLALPYADHPDYRSEWKP